MVKTGVVTPYGHEEPVSSIQQARIHFPNATIVGTGGDGWCVVTRCWPKVRIMFFADEATARQAIETLPCSAPTCLGRAGT
jgi:hypothetical protein